MKTLLLKNGMPVATAVLAIAGAFATTSMQSSSMQSSSMQGSSSAYQLIYGYVLSPNGECEIAVICSDIPNSQLCRVWYPGGPLVYLKSPVSGNCIYPLYRPKL